MNLTTIILAVFLPLACLAAAAALMHLFDVKDAATEQVQVEVRSLLSKVNRDVQTRRRVRAGAPSNATSAEFSRFASMSSTRIRFPSA
jgi:hypothetical protein